MSTLAKTRPIKLTDGDRAELFLAMGRGLNSGLPPDRVLEGAKDVCDGKLNRQLRLASNGVRKGTSLILALDRGGLISEIDYAMLSCAEDAGAIDVVMLSLAERYESRHNRWRKLKGKLLYPAVIFVIALFLAPLPALFAERITGTDYILRSFGMLALFVMIVHVFQMLLRQLNANGWPMSVSRLARVMPYVGNLARLHERSEFNGNLAIMLKSGLSVRDALEEYRRVQPEGLRREHIVQAKSAIEGGSNVTDALHETELIDDREGFAIISTGEGAGKLEEGLLRYSLACESVLEHEYDLIARAVPVVVFLMVALMVASGLVG